MHKTLWLAVLLAATAMAGCLGDGDSPATAGDDAAADDRLTTDEWRALLSTPRFDSFTETVHHVTADDGTDLALTLFLPAGLGADEQIPTLLELTPYQTVDRTLGGAGAFGPTAGAWWSFFVERGAAFVRADERGGHNSGGCYDFGGDLDRADTRTFTHWIREQPWSDGRIVTDGLSHPGMGSVVAHVADPDLTAAIAVAPVVSYYQDEWLQGAKFEDQQNGVSYQAIDLAPTTTPLDAAATANQAATCHGQMTADFAPVEGHYSALWQERDLAWQLESGTIAPSDAPILLAHGFADVNVHTDHSQLYWDALPDDANKYALFGWWAHQWPVMEHHPAASYADWRHRFLDQTLFGIDNGILDEPRVLVEDSTGAWHESHDWPLDGSHAVTLFPAANGSLAATAPAAGDVSYVDDLGTRRHDWVGSVTFSTAPLANATLVNGAPTIDLVATSTHDATKWVVVLNDVAPDGTRARISHGYADSHMRAPRVESWESITPGAADNWTIPLLPTAVVVEAGHSLEVIITSQDSRITSATGSTCYDGYDNGCYSPSGILAATSVGEAVNTVFTGPDGTRITLHAVDPMANRIAVE